MAENHIKHVIDQGLGPLRVTERDMAQLMQLAEGGKKIKHKVFTE